MKNYFIMLAVFLLGFLAAMGFKEKANSEKHIAISDFPKNMVVNHLNGWGGMSIAVNENPAGTDLGPLLEGLKNNSCQVPHWGYILKGSLKMIYDEEGEVILNEGDLFYMPPGHSAVVLEDLKILDFSPEKGMKQVVEHIEKKVAEMSNN